MTTVPRAEAAIPPEDPALRFIRLELAPSPQRWIATLGFTGLALIGVLATVTFRIPYPVLVFAGILLLTLPPATAHSNRLSRRPAPHFLAPVSPSCWRSPPTISPGSTYRCNVRR
jgi:hypothetical protein